jgi:hypothetical protein
MAMPEKRYLVSRTRAGVTEYLDQTEPDVWSPDWRVALSSGSLNYIATLAGQREHTRIITRKQAQGGH